MAPQIAQADVTQGDAKIQQLQTGNHETIAESIANQDKINNIQNELNYEYANVEVL
jgi:hypothetical protein